jgi:Leu/Phe-tRNA-protein transferase
VSTFAELLDCQMSAEHTSAHLGAQARRQDEDGHEADLRQHKHTSRGWTAGC